MRKKKDKKTEDIAGKLLGMEMELDILEQDIESIDEDLSRMSAIKESLIYNIEFLKKPDIIAIYSEYKRSIDDLKQVKIDMNTFNRLRIKLQNKIDKLNKEYKICMEDYEKEYEQSIRSKVVLLFDKKKKG